MARSNSPRSHVRTHFVNVMRATKKATTMMMDLWDGRSTVFEVYTDETGRRNSRQVPRPAEDYPENQVGDMNYAIDQLDNMIRGLNILRNQMIDERDALAEGRPSPTY